MVFLYFIAALLGIVLFAVVVNRVTGTKATYLDGLALEPGERELWREFGHVHEGSVRLRFSVRGVSPVWRRQDRPVANWIARGPPGIHAEIEIHHHEHSKPRPITTILRRRKLVSPEPAISPSTSFSAFGISFGVSATLK